MNKRINKFQSVALLIVINLIVVIAGSGCSLIPTTDTAKERMYNSVIPHYVSYVEPDSNYTREQKNKKTEAVGTMDYDRLCRIIIPEYITYLETDPKLIKDHELQKSYIIKAKSYLKVKKHFDSRL